MRSVTPLLLHLAHAVLCDGAAGPLSKGGRRAGLRATHRASRHVSSRATSPDSGRLHHLFAHPANSQTQITAENSVFGAPEAVPVEALLNERTVYAIRPATADDISSLQHCNRATLPENYQDSFYQRHLRDWHDLSYVAHSDDENGIVVGYVLGRLDDMQMDPEKIKDGITKMEGHITSLAVLDAARRKGLAKRLMRAVHREMVLGRGLKRSKLHVRCSNYSAMELYSTLGYTIINVVDAYYLDGEAAYLMAAPLQVPLETRS